MLLCVKNVLHTQCFKWMMLVEKSELLFYFKLKYIYYRHGKMAKKKKNGTVLFQVWKVPNPGRGINRQRVRENWKFNSKNSMLWYFFFDKMSNSYNFLPLNNNKQLPKMLYHDVNISNQRVGTSKETHPCEVGLVEEATRQPLCHTRYLCVPFIFF